MDLREASNIDPNFEYRHWWIATRFSYLDQMIKQSKKSNLHILEVGCGTGQNLRHLAHDSKFKNNIVALTGHDLNLPSDFSPPAWSTKNIKWINKIGDAEEKYDIILAMDVLEHIEDHESALLEWKNLLKPGGQIFMTVPAFMSLWSYHDVILGHKRRYRRADLLQVTQKAGLLPIKIRYAFSLFFPLVYFFRKINGLGKKPESTDLVLLPAFLNALFLFLGKMESWAGGNPFFGTSLIGTFQK